jgi:hypothetical protein
MGKHITPKIKGGGGWKAIEERKNISIIILGDLNVYV